MYIFSILAITFVPDHQKSKILNFINSIYDLYPLPYISIFNFVTKIEGFAQVEYYD